MNASCLENVIRPAEKKAKQKTNAKQINSAKTIQYTADIIIISSNVTCSRLDMTYCSFGDEKNNYSLSLQTFLDLHVNLEMAEMVGKKILPGNGLSTATHYKLLFTISSCELFYRSSYYCAIWEVSSYLDI
jgi:hypothetical protein